MQDDRRIASLRLDARLGVHATPQPMTNVYVLRIPVSSVCVVFHATPAAVSCMNWLATNVGAIRDNDRRATWPASGYIPDPNRVVLKALRIEH